MQSKSSKKWANPLILILFSLSALIGLAILGISVWGDSEASMFNLNQRGDQNLGTLSCPIMITTKEVGKISAKITNPIERKIKPSVRFLVSSSHIAEPREENVRFQLAPSESKKLNWKIDPTTDSAFGEIVLVKVYLFKNYPIPSKDATCGILVVDLPAFSGNSIVYSGIGFSLVGMLASIIFWQRNNRLMTIKQREVFRAFWVFTAATGLGLVGSLLGYWILGIAAIVVAVLITVITVLHIV